MTRLSAPRPSAVPRTPSFVPRALTCGSQPPATSEPRPSGRVRRHSHLGRMSGEAGGHSPDPIRVVGAYRDTPLPLTSRRAPHQQRGGVPIGYAPSRVPNASRLGTEYKEAGWSAPRGERRRVGVSSPSPAGGVIPALSNVARPAAAECVTLHKLRPKAEGHPGKANWRHGGQRFEEEPSQRLPPAAGVPAERRPPRPPCLRVQRCPVRLRWPR